ncbi:hypothetical protein [Paenibacillus sp. 1P07SE]|uniref:hypothetical protein n=1 Tax=Paenibacillus sp. 1P07SE TaxID=3132209 RepID=UPI0039A696E7
MQNRKAHLRLMIMVLVVTLLLPVLPPPVAKAQQANGNAPSLQVGASQIVLRLGDQQQWIFDKDGNQQWGFTAMQIQADDASWTDLFNNEGSFILGADYNSRASGYTVLSNTPELVSIRFTGAGSDAGNDYTWEGTLEARAGMDWVKRTFTITYAGDGLVYPSFAMLSEGVIRERTIATYSPKNSNDQPFDIALPLILGRLDVGPMADLAILMDNETLSAPGGWASIKSNEGVTTIGANAGIHGAEVEGQAVNTVESYIYARNGSDSSFRSLTKTATDAYWDIFDYPSGLIGYPLTPNIPTWEDAANGLLDYFGNDTTASSDHTFISSDGVGWYMPYSDSDMPGIAFADVWGSSGISRGALTYAQVKGESTLYQNIKTLTDNFVHGGFIINDGSNDDGWHHQFFDETGFVGWQGLDGQMPYTNPNYFYDPIISAYMMYQVTGDEDYREAFRSMVEFVKRNFSLDQEHYSQPAGYKVYGEPDPYEPYGGELGEQGLDNGGGAAAYALTMLYAAKEFDDETYRELGLNTVKHMLSTRYDQMYGIRTTPKNESFAYAVRALVEAYEAGLGEDYLDEAEAYAAQMLLTYFFYNYTWDNDGEYNTHPTVGLARADTIERQIAFREAAESMWYASSILKYRTPDTLLKMLAMARQNQLWFLSKNDSYLGYGVDAYPEYLPYEFILQDRVAPREVYGAGDVFMMYMLFEAFGNVSDDQVVSISPTAVEEYQSEDHTFVLYNTSDTAKTVTFKLQNMTDGTYHILRNDQTDGMHEYGDLSTSGLSVQVPAEGSYRIRAVLADTGATPQTPAAPAAAATGDDTITLTWTETPGADVEHYEIYRGTDASFVPDRSSNRVGQTKRLTFTDLGLTPSTTYYYKLKAVASSGMVSAGASSSQGIATTANTAPSMLHNLAQEAVHDRERSYRWITMSWDATAAEDFAKYNVYRRQPGTTGAEWVGESYVNNYIDDQAESGATYEYLVAAEDRLGNEGPLAGPVQMSSAYAGTASAGDEFTSDAGWTLYSADYTVDNGSAVVTENGNDSYGYIGRSFTIDVDRNPYVTIQVSSASQEWALKVNGGQSDIDLQPQTSSTGEHIYNLKAATGWSGSQTFTIKLFSVGEGSEASFGWVRFTPLQDELATDRLWQEESASMMLGGDGTLTVTQSDPQQWEGNITSSVTSDLDVNTHISVKVDEATSRWALRVNDGNQEFTLQPPTTATGVYDYDLRALTRWSGVKTYNLKLYAVDSGSSVTFDWIRNGPYHEGFGKVTAGVRTYRDMFKTVAGWVEQDASLTLVPGGAIFAEESPGSSGYAAKTYNVHLDQSPYVFIDVRSVSGSWELRADKGDGSPAVVLQPATSEAGSYAYNVKQLTGWSGSLQISLQLHAVGEGSEVDVHELAFGAYDESFANARSWTDETSLITASGGQATVRMNAPQHGYGSVISDTIHADLNATPYLRVKVDEATDLWALKVNAGGADVDVQQDTGQNGVFTYDLREATGWSGQQDFQIRIYAIGSDAEVKLDWLHLSPDPAWNSAGAQGRVLDGKHLTIEQVDPDTPWGIVTRNIRVDLSAYPLLELDVSYITATNGYWAMRVSDGSETKQLQLDGTMIGVQTYDVAALTGWSGVTDLTIQLIPVHQHDELWVDAIRFIQVY